jgi:hypothetical protein
LIKKQKLSQIRKLLFFYEYIFAISSSFPSKV